MEVSVADRQLRRRKHSFTVAFLIVSLLATILLPARSFAQTIAEKEATTTAGKLKNFYYRSTSRRTAVDAETRFTELTLSNDNNNVGNRRALKKGKGKMGKGIDYDDDDLGGKGGSGGGKGMGAGKGGKGMDSMSKGKGKDTMGKGKSKGKKGGGDKDVPKISPTVVPTLDDRSISVRVQDYYLAYLAIGSAEPTNAEYEALRVATTQYFSDAIGAQFPGFISVQSTIDFTAFEDPTLPPGSSAGQFNIYVSFAYADYRFEQVATVPTTTELFEAMRASIEPPTGVTYILDVVRPIGGPFAIVEAVQFGPSDAS